MIPNFPDPVTFLATADSRSHARMLSGQMPASGPSAREPHFSLGSHGHSFAVQSADVDIRSEGETTPDRIEVTAITPTKLQALADARGTDEPGHISSDVVSPDANHDLEQTESVRTDTSVTPVISSAYRDDTSTGHDSLPQHVPTEPLDTSSAHFMQAALPKSEATRWSEIERLPHLQQPHLTWTIGETHGQSLLSTPMTEPQTQVSAGAGPDFAQGPSQLTTTAPDQGAGSSSQVLVDQMTPVSVEPGAARFAIRLEHPIEASRNIPRQTDTDRAVETAQIPRLGSTNASVSAPELAVMPALVESEVSNPARSDNSDPEQGRNAAQMPHLHQPHLAWQISDINGQPLSSGPLTAPLTQVPAGAGPDVAQGSSQLMTAVSMEPAAARFAIRLEHPIETSTINNQQTGQYDGVETKLTARLVPTGANASLPELAVVRPLPGSDVLDPAASGNHAAFSVNTDDIARARLPATTTVPIANIPPQPEALDLPRPLSAQINEPELPIRFGEPVQTPVGNAPASPVSTATYPPPTLPMPPAHRQLVEAILQLPDGEIDLKLRPDELGAIRLQMQTEGDTLRVVISAERPETMDLLRKSQSDLHRLLRDAGVENPHFHFSQDRQRAMAPEKPEGRESAVASQPEVGPVRTEQLKVAGRLDLRL